MDTNQEPIIVSENADFDHAKASDKELAEHQHRLQHAVGELLVESDVPERFVVRDELTAKSGGGKGLPAGVGLQRSLTDPDVVVETAGDRRWRRSFEMDKTGVETPGSQHWVEQATG